MGLCWLPRIMARTQDEGKRGKLQSDLTVLCSVLPTRSPRTGEEEPETAGLPPAQAIGGGSEDKKQGHWSEEHRGDHEGAFCDPKRSEGDSERTTNQG